MNFSRSHSPTKNPIVLTKSGGNNGSFGQVINKTKSAICFLCLFDGLRIPSIRRLVRKPRNICDRPLLTFDPTYYAPDSRKAIEDMYNNAIKCPCDFAVDPSAQTVLTLLRKHCSSMPPQRILLHYFGQGCHPPSDDGNLFFFSDDRSRYKPIKVANLLNSCNCPICAIIDSPSAGSLYRSFQCKHDVFAFFACGAGELLPVSTDAPLDIFSSCLLCPYEIAIWFYHRHHSGIIEVENNATTESKDRLIRFLNSILDSILFDTQSQDTYNRYLIDPAVFSLARGFVLAQRVMSSFNIHPSSIPELKPMESHPLWGLWDTTLDCAIALNSSQMSSTIFSLVTTSFDTFPSTSLFPIFAYFLTTEYHFQIAQRLLNYIDSMEGAATIAAHSIIPSVIVSLEKPSVLALIILSKIIAISKSSPFEQQTPINFSLAKDPGVLKAGMCMLCVSISSSPMTSFNRLTQICIDHAAHCAPYSALLLGLLAEKSGRLMTLPNYIPKFLPLLKSRKDDIRSSAVFVIGNSRQPDAAQILLPFLQDKSPFVRCQAIWGVCKSMAVSQTKDYIDQIEQMIQDKDENVRKTAESLLPYIKSEEIIDEIRWPQNHVLMQLLVKSVSTNGFVMRFEDDVFMLN
ncbi:hypothetical protein TVAG_413410 [Trichomonas vaginalis G3]|uniref:Raptor N-terminal CASPase-like domain-containing protein n=1 Tax=Trichomonas vaginalis (strain ATCC PRA-98 / G3) TaxID=412133 RepID=A2F9H3_TRIV3|nr:TOR signaling [Trichomonas vaginalis G3]EAX98444.1 hypothetical protein TVAG_413410 [Trichomonas vaginalis G3]KAI5493722.1 TOR signaling [Trichomonas vaginalis G3]|eukprot:XP_001311374.1 hypothetical protein [Trichomonas vaginalis G3]